MLGLACFTTVFVFHFYYFLLSGFLGGVVVVNVVKQKQGDQDGI